MFPVKSLELERSTEFDLNTLYWWLQLSVDYKIRLDWMEWCPCSVILQLLCLIF